MNQINSGRPRANNAVKAPNHHALRGRRYNNGIKAGSTSPSRKSNNPTVERFIEEIEF
jgi:hypothetical protein